MKVDPAFPSLGPAPGQAVSVTSDDWTAPDVMEEGSQAPSLVLSTSLGEGRMLGGQPVCAPRARA